MAMSKMAERKDDLLHLDPEQQVVETLLSHVQPAELRRPLRPFIVLTLDTVDWACWLFGMDASREIPLKSIAGAEGEDEEDSGTLSIPRAISCLQEDFSCDRLVTLGMVLLGGAATGGTHLALASMGAGVPMTPALANALSGAFLACFGSIWLFEERLEVVPRWFVRMCSANALIGALFHFGMVGLHTGGWGPLCHISPELIAMIKSNLDSQMLAPYFLASMVTFPLTVACCSQMAGKPPGSAALPMLYGIVSTSGLMEPSPYLQLVFWGTSVALVFTWWLVVSKDYRRSETQARIDWNLGEQQDSMLNKATHMFSLAWALFPAAQAAALLGQGVVDTQTLQIWLAFAHASAVFAPMRTLLRDGRRCEAILAAAGGPAVVAFPHSAG